MKIGLLSTAAVGYSGCVVMSVGWTVVLRGYTVDPSSRNILQDMQLSSHLPCP